METPASRHDKMLRLHRRLIRTLSEQTQIEPRDFDYELEQVWDHAVTHARAHRRYEPTYDEVKRADMSAAGHVDWSTKLPLYVAELVYYPDKSPHRLR